MIRRGLVVALCAALMAGACSGGDDDGSGPGEEGAGGPADADTGDGGRSAHDVASLTAPSAGRRQPPGPVSTPSLGPRTGSSVQSQAPVPSRGGSSMNSTRQSMSLSNRPSTMAGSKLAVSLLFG